MRVHSVLPEALTAAVDAALAGVEHVPHTDVVDMRGAELAASDPEALALIGPFRSAAVAEAVEATAPVGLPLLAPVATWAGVTRGDEPCAGHPARHRGTVLRMVARDTAVAGRLAEDVRAAEQHAFVVAGEHEYGVQLDGQLDHVGLPRVDDPADADLVVLCGLAGGPEVARAAGLGLPVIAFSGVEGEPAGIADLSLVLPFAPEEDMSGTTAAARAATLISEAVAGGALDRAALLSAMRIAGPFDEHGDPVDPPVWLYRAAADWCCSRTGRCKRRRPPMLGWWSARGCCRRPAPPLASCGSGTVAVMSIAAAEELHVQLLHPAAVAPTRTRAGDAAFDLRCVEDFSLAPGERAVVPTGVAVALPEGTPGSWCPAPGSPRGTGSPSSTAPA